MIKRILKSAGIMAVALALVVVLPIKTATAANPLLTVRYVVTNLNHDGGVWKESTSAQAGDVLELDVEMHNTEVGTTATNPKVRATFTTGTFTAGTSTVRFSADNAGEARDQIALAITSQGGGSLAYITGSTRLFWDPNGDGVKDFNGTVIGDGIASGGISLPGNMNGCNQFIAQITFRVRVKAGQNPTPTPTPTPTPPPTGGSTPTPPPGGQEQHQEQTQNNTQNQTVNVTQNVTQTQQTPAPQVAGVKELPKTGPAFLAWSALASAAPIGVGLRFWSARLRRRSTQESEFDAEDSSDWLELSALKKKN